MCWLQHSVEIFPLSVWTAAPSVKDIHWNVSTDQDIAYCIHWTSAIVWHSYHKTAYIILESFNHPCTLFRGKWSCFWHLLYHTYTPWDGQRSTQPCPELSLIFFRIKCPLLIECYIKYKKNLKIAKDLIPKIHLHEFYAALIF